MKRILVSIIILAAGVFVLPKLPQHEPPPNPPAVTPAPDPAKQVGRIERA